MIRALVVDDSPTARSLVVEILRSDPEIQVVGEGRNGVEGVALTQKLRPQVVTMDIHMPGLDGLAATKEIMITAPTPIVVVTGSTENREVEFAMHALRAGAVAVLSKPCGPGSPGFEEEARKFIATVKAMAEVKVVRHWRTAGRPGHLLPPRPGVDERGSLVAIVTSTGGPAAMHRLFSELPGDFPVPILVVQHITPGFTPGLAAWLNTASALRVKVAEQGEALAPQTVYLAPDDRHLGVSGRNTVLLSGVPPIGGFRPSGNFLFESVARAFGRSSIAVILTGMGEDGVAGLRAIRQAGGRIIAQDEQTSVVFGMPSIAISEGLPDMVLPLDSIASRLEEFTNNPPPNS